MVIADEYLIEFRDNVASLPYTHFSNLLMHFLAFLDILLSAGFPPHSELSVLCSGTDVCKPEEIESLRLLFVSRFTIMLCKSPKLDQPALLF